MSDPGFALAPARYAGRWNGKPQVAVKCESDGSGTKTRAMRICSALNMRWSNRGEGLHNVADEGGAAAGVVRRRG
jgi:hypothetical protein